MSELLTSREETASALEFIRQKGLADEFGRRAGLMLTGESLQPAKRRRSVRDAAIDREIDATLAAQLSGRLDLSGGRESKRVDLSGGGGTEATTV